MATKKTTSSKKAASKKTSEQKVTAPKKTTRKTPASKAETSVSEVSPKSSSPKSAIFTRKYLYAVAAVLAVIGLLFAASRLWVVAWVDNKPLTKFELYSVLEKRSGTEVAEELIVEKLLMSEASKKNQNVSDAEIDAEITKIETQQGGAEQLNQILSIQKISRDDFRKLVKLQLLKQKLFGNDLNITDEDVEKYIEENKDSLPPALLANKESSEAGQLRLDIREQLKQLKVNENFNNWLNEALSSSRVVRNS